MDLFKALVVRKSDEEVSYEIESVEQGFLDEGTVLIKVNYSSLNYKDMLATQAKGGVIRQYPMIPGIDLSGVVVETKDDSLQVGQEVLITGFDLGVKHTGGLAEYAQVPTEWVIPLPENLSLKDAMIYGTAGFTAAQSVRALEGQGMSPKDNPNILVTGATGGVGSIALAILVKAGYNNITAMIRKDYQEAVAKELGAHEILWADDIGEKKALASQNYDYVLDTVGGDVAATLIPQIQENGSMSLCGNAAGIKLDTTVLPFILRGVNLLGINSVTASHEERQTIWSNLATDWNVVDNLKINTVKLEDVSETIKSLKEGSHIGRTVVEMD
ncbi:YhdH/YhfP family quinone oxidoreductase [Aerococcaceae bacterium DSM 111021]|nr:YhdH/YhfP family quinone oxidoreductase [Aerococcaceae bacterium DSM 111021]